MSKYCVETKVRLISIQRERNRIRRLESVYRITSALNISRKKGKGWGEILFKMKATDKGRLGIITIIDVKAGKNIALIF